MLIKGIRKILGIHPLCSQPSHYKHAAPVQGVNGM